MKETLKSIIVFIITLEARLILWRYKPTIIAVTGSVGKTSAKDAIYTVLQKKFFIRKSEKSYNSEIGVPLTVLGCPNAWQSVKGWILNIVRGLYILLIKGPYPEILVIEVGADRPRDIEKLATWLRPNISVITRLAAVPVHVEFFKSPEELIREKAALIKHSLPEALIAVCFDDEKIMSLPELDGRRVVTFGFKEGSFVRGFESEIAYDFKHKPIGISFKISRGSEEETASVSGTAGNAMLYALLAAVTVGINRGLSLKEVSEALIDFVAPPGRMRILSGINDSVIIDDSYNSSPIAAAEALRSLKNLEGQERKIAVLGDMLELGKYSVDEHKNIGREAAFADKLVVVGVRSRDIATGAKSAKMLSSKIKYFETAGEAGAHLKKNIKKGDIVLVKGSQGMRMEKVVEEIMAEPEKKRELLVRQDEEWVRR